jgi:hypothetical protein
MMVSKPQFPALPPDVYDDAYLHLWYMCTAQLLINVVKYYTEVL